MFKPIVGPVSSSGRALAFIVHNWETGGSSPQRGMLVSQLEMITVKCDFIVLSMFHIRKVKTVTGVGRVANVEYSVLCDIRQSQDVCSPRSWDAVGVYRSNALGGKCIGHWIPRHWMIDIYFYLLIGSKWKKNICWVQPKNENKYRSTTAMFAKQMFCLSSSLLNGRDPLILSLLGPQIVKTDSRKLQIVSVIEESLLFKV